MSLSDKKYIKDAYPLLGKIDSPSDLRKLRLSELPTVCAELRKFMIEALSENPGHFASSMGAVELTVALHYALNTPYDRVVWDVGHQSYVHKILTGRQNDFAHLRQFGGLSGFPKPSESPTDAFVAGHASSSVSIALGMARARTLQKQNYDVVALIGDGACTGGMAYEGINDLADSKEPMVLILNDNEMSISENVGSMARYLAVVRAKPQYNKLKAKTYDYTPQDGECLKKIIEAPRAQLNDLVEKYGKLTQANIGNYHLEMCAAADGRFTALQLFRFVNYEYTPVTDVCIYEEAESLLIQKLF